MKGPKHLTIVIKIGTSSIVDEKTHEPILPILALIVDTAINLRRDGHKVIIVSSGAIGVGLQRMNISQKPKILQKKQALAAIGQCRLMSIWDSLFAHMKQPVAQILLTRNDIADRQRYKNAQNTITEVLAYDAIPIINENDTLAVAEIKFGDNDTLSAIAAAMVHADYLFLMTDVEALYDKNPRTYPDAQPIRTVSDIDALNVDVSSSGSSLGTGGMATKITAARLATSTGTTTIITKSSKPGNIKDIINYFHPREHAHGEASELPAGSVSTTEPPLHTRFLPSESRVGDRRFWIRHALVPRGTIYIDRGAADALLKKNSLFPAGIVDVEGRFDQQEAVRLVVVDRHSMGSLTHFNNSLSDDPMVSPVKMSSESLQTSTSSALPGVLSRSQSTHTMYIKGEEIGRAISEYSIDQVQRIKGLRSAEISEVLGYADSQYVAHRDNVSLSLNSPSRPQTPRPRSWVNDKSDDHKDGHTVNMTSSGFLEQMTGLSLGQEKGSVTPLGVDGRGARSRNGTPESSIADLRDGR